MIEAIDAYVAEIDSLKKKSYREGEKEKEELYLKIKNFVLTNSPDGEKLLAELNDSLAKSSAGEITEEKKQEVYMSYLNAMQTKLAEYKGEILEIQKTEDEGLPDELLLQEAMDLWTDVVAGPPLELKCSACGEPYAAGAVYCASCGAKITNK